jgi:GWxTD domain-containing protein
MICLAVFMSEETVPRCMARVSKEKAMRVQRWLCVWLIGISTLARGQVELVHKEVVDPYYIDAISFASGSPDRSRLDVFIQVPYSDLAFVKTDNGYTASYEMTIDILDSTDQLFTEKLWTENVQAQTFDQSVSTSASSLVRRVFELPPGRYSVVTIVRDKEQKEGQRLVRKLAVSRYDTAKFTLSDIMLVSRLSRSEGKTTIVPSVSPNVGVNPGGFHIFFETYNHEQLDSVKFVIDILNEAKEVVSETVLPHSLEEGRNQMFVKLDSDSLPIGNYRLFVRAYGISDSVAKGVYLAETSRFFVVRWQGLPRTIKDIDLAIEQCVYIAKDAEMSHMREAKTKEEKQRRFIEFWKKRDPNPNTPRNEKMEAYFAKVDYANKNFKTYIEGWRTDMGMVYIIFGPPSNVDRHPFDIDSKPYEVWTYYELNHSFVFADQTGFGDYRLTTPIWEVWQRPKD